MENLVESKILYEIVETEEVKERVRHPNIGRASRQAQKEWRRGTLIWNSYEKGTYRKEYAKYLTTDTAFSKSPVIL
jgi:hypothetical protein